MDGAHAQRASRRNSAGHGEREVRAVSHPNAGVSQDLDGSGSGAPRHVELSLVRRWVAGFLESVQDERVVVHQLVLVLTTNPPSQFLPVEPRLLEAIECHPDPRPSRPSISEELR